MVALAAQLIAGGLAGGFAWYWVGAAGFAPAGLALILMVPPTLMTHVLTWFVSREVPEIVVSAALMSSGLRMFWAVMATFGLADLVRQLGASQAEFGGWMCGFYILGLTVQITLLVIQVQRGTNADVGR